jgi:hypothetical protein
MALIYNIVNKKEGTLSKNDKLAIISFAVFAFFISYYFGLLYTKGDQLLYTRFYENVHNYTFLGGFLYYYLQIGAAEPFYYLFVFIFSLFIEKVFLFSCVNAIFAYFIAKNLLNIGLQPIILWVLSLNYYLMVLFLAAERLKLSLTLLAIAFYVKKRKKILFAILAFLSHFQSVLLLFAFFAKQIDKTIKLLFQYKLLKKIWVFIPCLIGIGLVFFFFQSSILGKLAIYTGRYMDLNNIIKPLFFALLSLYYGYKRKMEVLIVNIPLIITAYFVGSMRITIFSYFVFMYYGVQYKRGVNIGVVITSLYFFVRGIIFLQAVAQYGTGF